MASKDNHKKSFKPILAGTEDWPVVQLSKNREEFIEEVANEAVRGLLEQLATPEKLMDELEATLYSERMRIKDNPWKVDPEDDIAFWREIKSRLVDAAIGPEEDRQQASKEYKQTPWHQETDRRFKLVEGAQTPSPRAREKKQTRKTQECLH